MKRNFTFISVLAILLATVFNPGRLTAQVQTMNLNEPQLSIISSSDSKLVLQNDVGAIAAQKVDLEGQTYSRLAIPGYIGSRDYGSPEFPVRHELIEIPYGAQVQVKVSGYDIREYNLSDVGATSALFPAQPSQPKCGVTKGMEFNEIAYKTNAYSDDPLVSVTVLGRMRGVHIARVDISPVQVNPVTGMVRVYENLRFELNFLNGDAEATRLEKERLASPYFTAPYSQLLNYHPSANRENLTQYPVKYVIVSDPMFADQLQPFIEWKTKKGFTVIEAYTDVIGSTQSQIKTYLQGLYEAGTPDDPAPSFVLFVGDVSEIPAYENGNGETDRLYVEYTGDLFPEMFYGRFSAQNTSQLQPYIDKTLQYEMYTMPDPAYLDTVVLVAGMDSGFGASHGNGQINYGTINYFNEDHGIFSHTYLYPESGSNAANIHQNVSDGVTFGNYTAHCSPSGWADPSFVISDIANLSNQDKYGLLIGNCCSSSEYATTCFAEEILRAVNKGCVGYIGGSNSTYWDEDYYFGVGVGTISENPPSYEETGLGNYDRAFHDHGEPFNEWYTTMDQHIFAGNLAVSESGSGLETYYWDIYNLMGDPSLMIYYAQPDAMTVSAPAAITLGLSSITITAVPYAYVGLSMNGVLHGSGIADASGMLTLDFDAFVNPGDADLVVTAQNYQPYIAVIPVIPAEGPYVVYESHTISGSGLTYHESGSMVLTMENVGAEDATGVQVVLSTSNPYVTIVDNTVDYGTIPAGGSVEGPAPFTFTVADDMPDGEVVLFDVLATITGGDQFPSTFTEMGHAPALHFAGVTVNDQTGNGNGKLDPGETALLVISLSNNGSADGYAIVGQLSTTSSYLTLNETQMTYGDLAAGASSEASYSVTVAGDAPAGVVATETIDWLGSYGITGEGQFNEIIGQIPVLVVDLAQTNNSADIMDNCFTNLTVGSEMATSLPSDLSLYQSVFVILGTYPDNHVLSSAEGTLLADFLNNGGRVYMEGGDTWAYDASTAVHPMFHINGLSDGSGDLSTVTGQDGTFAQNFVFGYNGGNSYIDQLSTGTDAFALFRNESVGYDITIGYETTVYKTVGSSFEFGGLTDQGSGTVDGIMAEILNFFNLPFIWTGVEEVQQELAQVSVFPNPAGQYLNVAITPVQGGEATLELRDVLGRKVMNQSIVLMPEQKQTITLDVNALHAGLYYLVVRNGASEVSSKIIIQE